MSKKPFVFILIPNVSDSTFKFIDLESICHSLSFYCSWFDTCCSISLDLNLLSDLTGAGNVGGSKLDPELPLKDVCSCFFWLVCGVSISSHSSFLITRHAVTAYTVLTFDQALNHSRHLHTTLDDCDL